VSALDAALQSVGTLALLAAAVTLTARLHYLTRLPSVRQNGPTGARTTEEAS
jgi:hypothetical protein